MMDNIGLPTTLEGLVQELDLHSTGVGSGLLSDFEFTPNSHIPTTCNYISSSDSTIPTVVGNELSDYDYTSSTLYSTASSNIFSKSPDSTVYSEPWLEVIEQPCEMFRFRYLTESQGTPHGPVMGSNSSKTKKVFPTVRLHNFNGEATIRCWLFTVSENPGPHVHKLVSKIGQKAIKEEPHDIIVSKHNNYTASFENLVIIHAVRKECYDSYLKKKEMCQSKLPWTHHLPNQDKEAKKRLLADLKQEIKNMNMNIVTLYFEALVHNGNSAHKICHVISRPIKNKKNAEFGDLKIVRSDREFGSCRGGDEVFIFVEKITKDIKIKFYEEDVSGKIIWSDYATFSPLDIHHFVAIAFRTPPYKDFYIDRNVTIKYHLERPNDTSVSNAMDFTYKPSDYRPPLKRPRTALVQAPDSTSQLLNLDEVRMEESFDFLLSQFPSASGEYSLSEINVDASLSLGLPAVLDTDGPSEEAGTEERAQKVSKQKILESRIITEGRMLVENVIGDLQNLKNGGGRDDVLELISRVTKTNCCNSFHWSVALGLHEQFSKLSESVSFHKIESFLNKKNSAQLTPLHIAVTLGRKDFVEKLLEVGADPNLIDIHGNAPIHIASLYQPGCLESLLNEKRTMFNAKTKDGMNVLHLAAKCNNLESLGMLLRSKIDKEIYCNRTGDTALHIAAKNSFHDAMDLILKHDGNPNAQNHAGNTSLHFCVANNDVKGVQLLLRYKANPKICSFIKPDRTGNFYDRSSESESELENSDSTSMGQSTYDLSTCDKITEILKLGIKKSGNSETASKERNGLFSEEVMAKVCDRLDENRTWESIAQKLGHASLVSSMNNSQSPSKILLNYLDILGDNEETVNNLVKVLSDLKLDEIVYLIKHK